MINSTKEGVQQPNLMGSISQQQNTMINQTQTQNHSQSPQNQYQASNLVSNNDGNFKKTRPSGQGTPATSNNSINTNSQVSQNSQQMAPVGTGSNYIPNQNNQVNNQTSMTNSNNSNPNITVQQQQQNLQQSQQQMHQQQQSSKIS